MFSQSQAQLPSTLQLQSSATLGSGKTSSHKEQLDKLEDKQVRRTIDKYQVISEPESDEDERPDIIIPKAEVGSALRKNTEGATAQVHSKKVGSASLF